MPADYGIPISEKSRVAEQEDGSLAVELRTGSLQTIPAKSWTKTLWGWKFPYRLVDYAS